MIVPSSSTVYLQVGTGEQALGLAFEQGAYIYAQGDNATAGIVYPSDGTGDLFDVAALIKGAQHPNAAKAFLDFSVSAEFQKALINNKSFYGRRAVRADVPLPAGVPLAKDIRTIQYDSKWAADNRDANLKKYQELTLFSLKILAGFGLRFGHYLLWRYFALNDCTQPIRRTNVG